MSEVSADKGYLSAKSVVADRDAGVVPFIAFKSNRTDTSSVSTDTTVPSTKVLVDWMKEMKGKSYYSQRPRQGQVVTNVPGQPGDGLFRYDCSSSVSACLGLSSFLTVSGLAAGSTPTNGTLDTSKLQNGDLVIWQNPGHSAHVGIWDAEDKKVLSMTNNHPEKTHSVCHHYQSER